MGRVIYTPEERAEAKKRWRAAYNEHRRTPEGRARIAAHEATPQAQAFAKARYARYRETEKYRAVQARYAASQRGKATEAAYQAWVRATQPIRVKARAAVGIAVKQGALTRPTSCSCGAIGKLDAHHHLGYEPRHWLDVVWLCRKCHKAAH